MRRPNVLLITADQWRGDMIGHAGHPRVRTPHLDALAAEGTAFVKAFCQATPCSPARASLYTGLYQMTTRVVRNGAPLDRRHDTIAWMMRRAGYDSTLFGYTDQSVDPRETAGADPWLETYEGVLPGFTPRLRLPEHNGPWLSWLAGRGYPFPTDHWDIYRPREDVTQPLHRLTARFAAEEADTTFVTDHFLRWRLEQRERPWFAHVSYLKPHPPFVAAEPYASMHDPDDPLPFNRAARPEDDAALHPLVAAWHRLTTRGKFIVGAGEAPVTSWSEADFRAIRANYWGLMAEVDAEIGRMVATLKAAGQWDNTIVVFTADHGEMMGDHWCLGKFGFFDPAYHVPLIVKGPGMPAGMVTEALTEAIDIVPTLLDLAGVETPDWLDGRSLVGRPERDAVFYEFDFRELSGARAFDLPLDAQNLAVVRTKTAKYVHFQSFPPLLFNLADDPGEQVNRADDPTHARLRLEMAERLLDWRAAKLDRRLTGFALTPAGLVNERRAARP